MSIAPNPPPMSDLRKSRVGARVRFKDYNSKGIPGGREAVIQPGGGDDIVARLDMPLPDGSDRIVWDYDGEGDIVFFYADVELVGGAPEPACDPRPPMFRKGRQQKLQHYLGQQYPTGSLVQMCSALVLDADLGRDGVEIERRNEEAALEDWPPVGSIGTINAIEHGGPTPVLRVDFGPYPDTGKHWVMKVRAENAWLYLRRYGGPQAGARGTPQFYPSSIPNPSGGDCFRWAVMDAAEHGGTVVHAVVTEPHSRPPARFEHAWVERDGRVYDWQTMTQGHGGVHRGQGYPVDDFYELWRPEHVHRYSAGEAVGLVSRRRHYGPWSEEVARNLSHGNGDEQPDWALGPCLECGERCHEDESEGVFLHDDPAIDLDHVCVPDTRLSDGRVESYGELSPNLSFRGLPYAAGTVFVFRNLRYKKPPARWSVRDLSVKGKGQGKLVGTFEDVVVRDARFYVHESDLRAIRRHEQRFVCCGVVGLAAKDPPGGTWVRVSINPFVSDDFVRLDTMEPVHEAAWVRFGAQGAEALTRGLR